MLTAASAVGCGVAAAPAGRSGLKYSPLQATRTAQGNEIVLEQGGKHKNKLKLKLKHNSTTTKERSGQIDCTRANEGSTFFSMQARIGSRSVFFL
jgi:hypothetical protein